MNNLRMGLSAAMLTAALAVGCGGGNNGSPSPSAPTSPTPASVAITVNSLSATTERTSTGVTYHIAFTLRASGSVGAMVTALRVNLTNGTRSGSATFDNISDRLTAGGTFDERLRITSTNDTDLYNQISSVVVTYTADGGVSGSATSGSGSISAPPTAPTPTCTYSFSPSALSLGATGSLTKGIVQVTTTSGCAWTVVIADAWLNVSPTGGTGSGSLALVAADNITTTGASRTTRVTVGGATTAITQAGVIQTSTPAPSPIPAFCNAGPYQWDANPNVLRCRNRSGQFAPSACCGR